MSVLAVLSAGGGVGRVMMLSTGSEGKVAGALYRYSWYPRALSQETFSGVSVSEADCSAMAEAGVCSHFSLWPLGFLS